MTDGRTEASASVRDPSRFPSVTARLTPIHSLSTESRNEGWSHSIWNTTSGPMTESQLLPIKILWLDWLDLNPGLFIAWWRHWPLGQQNLKFEWLFINLTFNICENSTKILFKVNWHWKVRFCPFKWGFMAPKLILWFLLSRCIDWVNGSLENWQPCCKCSNFQNGDLRCQ